MTIVNLLILWLSSFYVNISLCKRVQREERKVNFRRNPVFEMFPVKCKNVRCFFEGKNRHFVVQTSSTLVWSSCGDCNVDIYYTKAMSVKLVSKPINFFWKLNLKNWQKVADTKLYTRITIFIQCNSNDNLEFVCECIFTTHLWARKTTLKLLKNHSTKNR